MAEENFESLVSQLGQLRERARRLADEDYISAKYKGFSSEGLTLDELMAELDEVEREIDSIENKLDQFQD